MRVGVDAACPPRAHPLSLSLFVEDRGEPERDLLVLEARPEYWEWMPWWRKNRTCLVDSE